MKKLVYLTNIQTPAKGAQSIQVMSMVKAFFKALGDDFLLISPENKLNKNLPTDFSWIKLKVGNFLPRNLRYLLITFRALRIILKEKPEFIYTRDIGVAFFYKLLGFRTCYEIHKPFETKLGKLFFKIISPKIKIVAISNALKKYITEKYNLEEKNILVAHDGVFLEDFLKIKLTKEEIRRRYLNLGTKNFIILYSGSLQVGKGVDLILKASSALKDILFIIIGGTGGKITKFKKDTPNNVLFVPRKPHQEIPYYLMASDLLTLPPTKELSYHKYTSPLKLFEYMASRVPILASNIGSITEILNEKNSFLFNPEDLNDLIDKINFARENGEERKKRADNAFQDVKNYTWQKRVSKILDFLNLSENG